MLRLTSLSEDNLRDLREVLSAAGLPVDDIQCSGKTFYRADDERESRGFVGIEPCGEDALLRSLVVHDRGRGDGALLVEAAVARARDEGVKRLWLLTTTARDFFLKQGFTLADRSAAPDAIRQTDEFRSLCPAMADCMTLEIGKEGL